MTQRILFPNDDGGVCVIIPAESVEAAIKDVPVGKPYLIVDTTDIPESREFRAAWTADFTGAEVKV